MFVSSEDIFIREESAQWIFRSLNMVHQLTCSLSERDGILWGIASPLSKRCSVVGWITAFQRQREDLFMFYMGRWIRSVIYYIRTTWRA